MHDTTALVLLRELARQNLLKVDGTTFAVPRYPRVVHEKDVAEAFRALADRAYAKPTDLRVSHNFGTEVWVRERIFEKIYHVVFTQQKLWARDSEGSQESPLPNIFVGADKTQVRQVPLVDRPPWPFKFLLELGGMIVVKTTDKKGVLLQLKQYLNNFPQYQIGVDAKEAPDGSLVVYTWWFREVPRLEKKGNLNVP